MRSMKDRMKSISAVLLSLLMVISMMPVTVFAETTSATVLELGEGATAGNLETDGYEWNNNTFELKLKNADINEVNIDSVKDKPITINLEGNNSIEKLGLVTPSSKGAVGNLTIKGNGRLNIVEYSNTNSSDYLLIDSGAEVVIEHSFQQYMGTLEVNGTLTAKGNMKYDPYSVYAQNVKIGAGGRINAYGKTGLNIKSDYQYGPVTKPAFEMAEGGSLYAPSSDCGIMVYTNSNSITQEIAEDLIKLPEGYFGENSSYGIRVLDQEQTYYAAVICHKEANPVLEWESVTGAGAVTVGVGNVITGGNITWTKGSTDSVVLTSGAELAWFEKLVVDDNVVAPENYTKAAGSTVITLKPEYLETLSDGDYIVKIMFTGGEGITKITVTHTHSGSAIVTPATCTKNGVKTHYKCDICNEYFEDAEFTKKIADIDAWKTANKIDKLAHVEDGKGWYKDDTYHYKKCRTCSTVIEKAAHTYGAWVVDQAATEEATGSRHHDCTVCGHRVTETIAQLPHTHKPVLVSTPSTCTVQGVKDYYKCKCGDYFEDAAGLKPIADIDAWKADNKLKLKNHEADSHGWYNDDAAGHYKKCKDCSAVFGKEAHTYGDWVVDQAATEEAAGSRHHDCTVCGHRVTETIAQLPHTHKPVLVSTPSTCTVQGVKDYYKCKCGDYFEDAAGLKPIADIDAWKADNKLKLKNHEADSHGWYNDDAAGHYKKCKDCSAVFGKEAHTYGDWVVDQAATEEAAGSRHHDCTVCGHRVTETIAQLPHTHKPVLVSTPPTCTEQGVKDYYKCSCGKYFEDAEGLLLIADLEAWKEANKLDAKGHTEDGNGWYSDETVHYKKCSDCDARLYEAAHTYGDWVIDKAATEEAAGSKHRNCTVCGHTETENIAKLPHTHKGTLLPGKDATTKNTGLKPCYKCEGCGKYFEDAELTKEIKGDIKEWRTIPKKEAPKAEVKPEVKPVVKEEVIYTPVEEPVEVPEVKEEKKETKPAEPEKTDEKDEAEPEEKAETVEKTNMAPVIIIIIGGVGIAVVAGTIFIRKRKI